MSVLRTPVLRAQGCYLACPGREATEGETSCSWLGKLGLGCWWWQCEVHALLWPLGVQAGRWAPVTGLACCRLGCVWGAPRCQPGC